MKSLAFVKVTVLISAITSAIYVTAAPVPDGEVIVVCPQGSVVIEGDTASDTECDCPIGTELLNGSCVTNPLDDLPPWWGDFICSIIGCEIDPGSGRILFPDVVDMCEVTPAGSDENITCEEAREACNASNISDLALCQDNQIFKARYRCRNGHSPGGRFDVSECPGRAWYCEQQINGRFARCVEEWTHGPATGGGGSISIAGYGIGGSSGTEPPGLLWPGHCEKIVDPAYRVCIDEVNAQCPVACFPEGEKAQMGSGMRIRSFLPRDSAYTTRAVHQLITSNSLEGERYLTHLGYRLFMGGEHEVAERILRLLVERYPRSANARSSLGDVLVGRDNAGAKRAFKAALEIQKDFAPAIYGLRRLEGRRND